MYSDIFQTTSKMNALDSTNGTIYIKDDNGEPEVTSLRRSLSDSYIYSKKKIKKDLLWKHLANLVIARH